MKNERGITLIALIIAIIVLLILAVVTIGGIRSNSIINHAENARNEWRDATVTENAQLTDYTYLIDKYTIIPLEDATFACTCEDEYLYDSLEAQREGPSAAYTRRDKITQTVSIYGRSDLKQENGHYQMKFYFTEEEYTKLMESPFQNTYGFQVGYIEGWLEENYVSVPLVFTKEGDYRVVTINVSDCWVSEEVLYDEAGDYIGEQTHQWVRFVLGFNDNNSSDFGIEIADGDGDSHIDGRYEYSIQLN